MQHVRSSLACFSKYTFKSSLNRLSSAKPCFKRILQIETACGQKSLSKWFLPVVVSQRNFGQPVSATHPHLIKEGDVTPGISLKEYRYRRENLLYDAIVAYKDTPKHHLMVFPSNSQQFKAYHVPHSFHQNSNFLYLSGYQEPDSVLVLHTCTSEDKDNPITSASALFVRENTKHSLLWDGPRSGVDGTQKVTGVDVTFDTQSIGLFLSRYCEYYPDFVLWYDAQNPVNKIFHSDFMEAFIKNHLSKNLTVENPQMLVDNLRLVKSKAELELLQKSADITTEAFIETMKFSYSNVKEAHLYAVMDFECRLRDAEELAYIPVIAGGDRANIIHYINNNNVVKKGELVLMDAGCEYHGYCSDITRTWPVSGTFTQPQRELYEAVLQVQEACIKLCTISYSIQDIYSVMVKLLGEELMKLKLIPSEENMDSKTFVKSVHDFCPTNVGHFLGMDIHDTPSVALHKKLLPGSCLAIEPGIYISKSRTDVPEQYRGIGIRIEDNVLVTDKQPIVLSSKLPKHPQEIEHILAKDSK